MCEGRQFLQRAGPLMRPAETANPRMALPLPNAACLCCDGLVCVLISFCIGYMMIRVILMECISQGTHSVWVSRGEW